MNSFLDFLGLRRRRGARVAPSQATLSVIDLLQSNRLYLIRQDLQAPSLGWMTEFVQCTIPDLAYPLARHTQ